MALILIVIGAIFLISGVRDTTAELGAQIKSDFTGQNNFIIYCAALFAAGAVGYIPNMRNPSRALLALILTVQVLANKGFFAKFVSQLSSVAPAAPAPAAATGAAQTDPTAQAPSQTIGNLPALSPDTASSSPIPNSVAPSLNPLTSNFWLGNWFALGKQ
jgi:hypothetical protein